MHNVSEAQHPGQTPGDIFVTITLDGQEHELQEGVYKIQQLKVMYGVPSLLAGTCASCCIG